MGFIGLTTTANRSIWTMAYNVDIGGAVALYAGGIGNIVVNGEVTAGVLLHKTLGHIKGLKKI
jgi:hypothetical protein